MTKAFYLIAPVSHNSQQNHLYCIVFLYRKSVIAKLLLKKHYKIKTNTKTLK